MFKMGISSRNVVEGAARAPHRAMYKAMGLTDDDLSKPFVGVCHTGNEATPCNIHLPGLAQKAKDGVKDAGATPREFSTIAVSDGISIISNFSVLGSKFPILEFGVSVNHILPL